MKKIALLAATAATMLTLGASPALAHSFTDNSVNNSFNTSLQVQEQSSFVSVSQTNIATSGDAIASGDGSFAFSGAAVYAPVSVYQSSVQAGDDAYSFVHWYWWYY